MDIDELLHRQHGVLSRRQLRQAGVDRGRIRRRVESGRWVAASDRVICTTTGRPTREQRWWAAVLHAPGTALLTGLAAAEHLGLNGWGRPVAEVLVPAHVTVTSTPWARYRRSRRDLDALASTRASIPSVRIEVAALMHASQAGNPRASFGVLAAVVQQGLTETARLEAELDALAPLPGARRLRDHLRDIEGGSRAGSEREIIRLCRRHGLRLPDRQVPRLDAHGTRRWTDCEWELPDGRTLVLEIDGPHHREVRTWQEDIRRSRAIVSATRLVVRCTAHEARHAQDQLAADLVRLGVPRA